MDECSSGLGSATVDGFVCPTEFGAGSAGQGNWVKVCDACAGSVEWSAKACSGEELGTLQISASLTGSVWPAFNRAPSTSSDCNCPSKLGSSSSRSVSSKLSSESGTSPNSLQFFMTLNYHAVCIMRSFMTLSSSGHSTGICYRIVVWVALQGGKYMYY